jgi:hypothetical protein
MKKTDSDLKIMYCHCLGSYLFMFSIMFNILHSSVGEYFNFTLLDALLATILFIFSPLLSPLIFSISIIRFLPVELNSPEVKTLGLSFLVYWLGVGIMCLILRKK